MKRVFKTRSAV